MTQKAKIWNNNIDHKLVAKHLYRKHNIATLSNQGNSVSYSDTLLQGCT
jgi:hypothetical protein